jgi:hypothetical protein
MDKIIIPSIAIAIPVFMFLCKNLLPALFNRAAGIKVDWVDILVEFIHFPFNIIMVAVGYTLPKTISNIRIWFGWHPIDPNLSPENTTKIVTDAMMNTLLNLGFTLLALFAAPFIVAFAKNAVDSYFKEQYKQWIAWMFLEFVLATAALIFSLKWGI